MRLLFNPKPNSKYFAMCLANCLRTYSVIYGNLCHTAQTYSRACMRVCIKIIYEDVTMGDAVTYECFIEFAVRGHHVY